MAPDPSRLLWSGPRVGDGLVFDEQRRAAAAAGSSASAWRGQSLRRDERVAVPRGLPPALSLPRESRRAQTHEGHPRPARAADRARRGRGRAPRTRPYACARARAGPGTLAKPATPNRWTRNSVSSVWHSTRCRTRGCATCRCTRCAHTAAAAWLAAGNSLMCVQRQLGSRVALRSSG
jgi:hypothetical protein